jgi:hypothetical protein
MRTLPWAPLLAYVDQRFETDEIAADALGVKLCTLRGWRRRTNGLIFHIDRVCIRLGRHPHDIYGSAWFEIPDVRDRNRSALAA